MTPALETEIKEVKRLRKLGDELVQGIKNFKAGTRERSLAITKAQESVMWLGMDLKRINDENPGECSNPYPNSKDSSNTIIEPTADGLKL